MSLSPPPHKHTLNYIHIYVSAYENKETVVLELTGPILMAGQCCVNIRVLLSSDFPIKVPEIYLMSDDRMSPKITNITDNNGKCIHSCISNWYHVSKSLLCIIIVHL